MSGPSYPLPPSPFPEKCFAFNMEMLHETLSWIFIYLFQKIKFSASEGLFGVFIPLLSITVLAKAENSSVKLFGNSPITELNSSIFSLSFAHNIVYHKMGQVIHTTRASSGTAFMTSKCHFSALDKNKNIWNFLCGKIFISVARKICLVTCNMTPQGHHSF